MAKVFVTYEVTMFVDMEDARLWLDVDFDDAPREIREYLSEDHLLEIVREGWKPMEDMGGSVSVTAMTTGSVDDQGKIFTEKF